jgi:hypothetical protein
VGGFGNNQSNKQFFGTDRRGSQQEINTESADEGRANEEQHYAICKHRRITNITTVNNERDIVKDGNSGQVTSQNLLLLGLGGREGKEKWGIFIEQGSAMPCAMCCYLMNSFSPSYNHTFALTFYVYSFTTEKML